MFLYLHENLQQRRRREAAGAATGVASCDAGSGPPAVPFDTSGPTRVRWPGHQPGQLYLGVSQEDALRKAAKPFWR